jgi:hypothetical protein
MSGRNRRSKPMRRISGLFLAPVLSCLMLDPAPATAGPPFRTDDPIPVEPGHWEIFTFSSATHVRSGTNGTLAGVDANYGAAPDLQLHATLPIAFDAPSGGAARFGYGDTEIGFKYRFVTGDPNGWRPDAAIYPAVDFPTGDASRNLGGGHVRLFLPLWLQKSFGKWTTFAGPGYWINPGIGNRNFWYYGWALQYQVAENLSLGGEIFHQTADTVDGKAQTGFDLGMTYDLTEHAHLMFAAGRGFQHAPETNEFSYYASVQWTF